MLKNWSTKTSVSILKVALKHASYCFTSITLPFHTEHTFFFFLAVPRSMWDLSSPTRDRTHTPALEVWSLNHWTAMEVPRTYILKALLIQHFLILYEIFQPQICYPYSMTVITSIFGLIFITVLHVSIYHLFSFLFSFSDSYQVDKVFSSLYSLFSLC